MLMYVKEIASFEIDMLSLPFGIDNSVQAVLLSSPIKATETRQMPKTLHETCLYTLNDFSEFALLDPMSHHIMRYVSIFIPTY